MYSVLYTFYHEIMPKKNEISSFKKKINNKWTYIFILKNFFLCVGRGLGMNMTMGYMIYDIYTQLYSFEKEP